MIQYSWDLFDKEIEDDEIKWGEEEGEKNEEEEEIEEEVGDTIEEEEEEEEKQIGRFDFVVIKLSGLKHENKEGDIGEEGEWGEFGEEGIEDKLELLGESIVFLLFGVEEVEDGKEKGIIFTGDKEESGGDFFGFFFSYFLIWIFLSKWKEITR